MTGAVFVYSLFFLQNRVMCCHLLAVWGEEMNVVNVHESFVPPS